MAVEDRVHPIVAGRYELTQTLGRGGMGTVWRGKDQLLRRAVAVKRIELPWGLDTAGHDTIRARVFREARAAAQINHPNAVTVFDVIESDGVIYLVMELVEARTLEERVRTEGPLEPAAAARIGLDLLRPLMQAHERGIVHRDVKPSNVMVPD